MDEKVLYTKVYKASSKKIRVKWCGLKGTGDRAMGATELRISSYLFMYTAYLTW